MSNWTVVCKIKGEASCTVEAETYEEAIDKAKKDGEWGGAEWDCDWSDYSGSIEAMEEN